jgi:hypothetical protein
LIRKSADNGVSWSTASSFQYMPGLESQGRALAADALGNVYVAGYGSSPAAKPSDPPNMHWLVRKSVDGGQTWTTVDDYYSALKGGYPKWGEPEKAHFIPGVGLFVVGQTAANANGYTETWTVRRSLDGGATWSTVDLYQPGGAGYRSIAYSVADDGQGSIYVVGRADVPQTVNHKTYTVGQAIVRRSSDGGASWSNVDTLSVGAGKIATATAVGLDAAGNIVVAGKYQDAQNVYHWIVRKRDTYGNWQTVDDYQLAAGYEANPDDLAVDAAGNLLVSGVADDGNGAHWVVRRLSATNP